MYQPVTDTYADNLLELIGPAAAPVNAVQLCQVAEALRQIRDPNGPTGFELEQAKLRVYAHGRGLVARIAAADKEINRLRTLLAAKTENGD